MAHLFALIIWAVLPVPFVYWALAWAWQRIQQRSQEETGFYKPNNAEHLWLSRPWPNAASMFGLPMLCGVVLALVGAVPERYFVQLQALLFTLVWPKNLLELPIAMAWVQTLWLSLSGVAFWEELLKYLALRYFYQQYWAEQGNYLQIGVAGQLALLGSLALASGFAAAENLWYMLDEGRSLPWRLLSSSLVHLSLAAVLGLRLHLQQGHRFFWFQAMLWHGSYNAALQMGWSILAIAILLALLLSSGWQLWTGLWRDEFSCKASTRKSSS